MKFIIVIFLLTLLAATESLLAAAGHEADIRAYNLGHGRKVFSEKCMKCHEGAEEDAPVLGDVDDWSTRIQQPLSQLISHAINGHGDMPPKGDLDISEQDVTAAVAYVVYHGRLIEYAQKGTTHTGKTPLPPGCTDSSDCGFRAALDSVVIKMLLLLTKRTSSPK